jgi:hypothetical protein
MVERVITPVRNVVDFSRYRQDRCGGAIALRICGHCGAALSEGEHEDECSSAFNLEAARSRGGPRKFSVE